MTGAQPQLALTPATLPTVYFIGVSTSKSSIMKVFPAWAGFLGLGNVAIQGIDFPLHAPAEAYRQAVTFIKRDPLSLGAMVTTHKIDLFSACEDLFDGIDPHARMMRETSCLSKRGGHFECHAKDPISSGLALDSLLGQGYFHRRGADVFAMGAGGSTIAITWYLSRRSRGADLPSRIVVSNRSLGRLDEIRKIHGSFEHDVPIDYVLAPKPEDNDAVLAELKRGSLVINATGLGKDSPGSPLTWRAHFPENAIAWDLNYRGDLIFLDQARAQAKGGVRAEDGWTYFLHGWIQLITDVFNIEIPTSGPIFEEMSEIAKRSTNNQ